MSLIGHAWIVLASGLAVAHPTFAQTYCGSAGSVVREAKISQSLGGFGGQFSPEANFGSALTPVGDLDGNGVEDVIVGAPREDGGLGGEDVGGCWVLFLDYVDDGNGELTLGVVQQTLISEGPGSGALQLADFDHFGASVACLGDGDGDGVVEVAVGAPARYGADVGAVWIIGLATDGTIVRANRIAEGEGGFGGDLDAGDNFGWSVANAGDLDGDGVDDLLIGAIGDDDGGSSRGSVWVAFLEYAQDGTMVVKSTRKISDTEGGFVGPIDDGDELGSSVASIGDLNGDGWQDIVVGAWRDQGGGTERGCVWVMFLEHDASGNVSVLDYQKISQINGGFGGGLADYDYFGASVANAGDLNGDGFTDIVIGAHQSDTGGNDRGAVWVVQLDGVGIVRGELKVGEGSGGFVGPLDNDDTFGHAVAVLPPNGGGNPFMLVGAPQDDDGSGEDKGAVWVLATSACDRCIADWNSDLTVNSLDFLAFLNSWTSGDPRADINGDGAVNTLDVLVFLNLWNVGCE